MAFQDKTSAREPLCGGRTDRRCLRRPCRPDHGAAGGYCIAWNLHHAHTGAESFAFDDANRRQATTSSGIQ